MVKRLIVIALLSASALPAPAFAANYYVASSAGTFTGPGTNCNGQTAITHTTLASDTPAAGSNIYICGNITAASGSSNYIQVQGAGTSGNPISVIFDTFSLTGTYSLGSCSGTSGTSCTVTCTASCTGNGAFASNMVGYALFLNTAAQYSDPFSCRYGPNAGGNPTPGYSNTSCAMSFITAYSSSTSVTVTITDPAYSPTSLTGATGTLGADLQAPYWSGAVINTESNNYINVNGEKFGLIQATANGTSLANQQDSGVGVLASGSSNSQITGTNIENIYVHTCTLPIANCTDEGGQNVYSINWNGGSNIEIGPYNVTHDGHWCYQWGFNNNNGTMSIDHNLIFHCGHGIATGDLAASSVTNGNPTSSTTCGGNNGNIICANSIHDGGNWDDASDLNHDDGIHTFTNDTGSAYTMIIAYNYCYGAWGHDGGDCYYEEGGATGNYVVRNILLMSPAPQGGPGILGLTTGTAQSASNIHAYNNTVIGTLTVCSDCTSNGSTDVEVSGSINGLLYKNNVVSGGYLGGCWDSNCGTITAVTAPDYNDWYNIGGGGWSCPTVTESTNFATGWQGTCSYDTHGTTNNPHLTSTYSLLNNSSAAWQTGTNLYSLGYAVLNTDYAGVGLPSAGNWDMGAYESSSSGASTPSPSPVVFVGVP